MTFHETVSSSKNVSTNSTELATTSQNVRREARHQRITNFQSLPADEANLIWPNTTPHSQRFDQSFLDSVSTSLDVYGHQHIASTTSSKEFDLFSTDSALSTPTLLSFAEPASDIADAIPVQGWTSDSESCIKRTSRRISNGIIDRVAKFESLGMECGSNVNGNLSRPVTTPKQNGQSTVSAGKEYSQAVPVSNNVKVYVPPTSLKAPQERQGQQSQEQHSQQLPHSQGQYESRSNRFDDGYDESMEETIKQGRKNKLAQRAQDLFQNSGPPQAQSQPQPQAQYQAISTPVATGLDSAPMPTAATTNFPNLGDIVTADIVKMESDVKSLTVSTLVPERDSPEINEAGYLQSGFNKPESFPPVIHPNLIRMSSPADSQSAFCRGSPHRRTESLASITSAASIADINIEETRMDTGVTMDDIAVYIEGPDPADNKWLCLYEDCRKRFGRKENIKSHVQTHLNDRQYQCPKCKKCFVRQHDLKRHAKIHTGIKPYPCECGNSFARHDALTRHKQRGMCIGAFDGIVRRTAKRGRPRKKRPDISSRLDKSARTRKRNQSTLSTSSHSECSDNSVPNSPHYLRDLEMLNEIPVMMAVDVTGSKLSVSSTSSSTPTINPAMKLGIQRAAMATMATPHAVASPSTMSITSLHSIVPERLAEAQLADPAALQSHPSSPTNSIASRYDTPPELSASSSPLYTNSARLFEVDANTTCTTSGEDISLETVATSTALEEHVLLEAWADGGDGLSLVNVDQDSGILMLSKFDEEYENAVNVFTESGDLLFESP